MLLKEMAIKNTDYLKNMTSKILLSNQDRKEDVRNQQIIGSKSGDDKGIVKKKKKKPPVFVFEESSSLWIP